MVNSRVLAFKSHFASVEGKKSPVKLVVPKLNESGKTVLNVSPAL